jgi:hypothetical protein
MNRFVLPLLLTMCVPLASSAAKYSPAQWIQFADVGSEPDTQTLHMKTIHLKSSMAKKTSKKKSRKKSKKSQKVTLVPGSGLKIQYTF